MYNIKHIDQSVDQLKLNNIFEALKDLVILLDSNNIEYSIGGYWSLIFKYKKVHRFTKDIDMSIHSWEDYNKLESMLRSNNKYKVELSKSEIEKGSAFKLTFNLNSMIMKIKTIKNDMPIRIDLFYNENKQDKEIFKMDNLDIYYNYKTCLETKRYYINQNSSKEKHEFDLLTMN